MKLSNNSRCQESLKDTFKNSRSQGWKCFKNSRIQDFNNFYKHFPRFKNPDPESKVNPNRSQGGHMGGQRIQNWSPKGSRKSKLEKVTNTQSQNVEKLKILKWKNTKAKMLIFHSFYHNKLSPPRILRKSNERRQWFTVET